jgi:hypothetical protein
VLEIAVKICKYKLALRRHWLFLSPLTEIKKKNMRKPTHQPVCAVRGLYRMWWRHVVPLSVLERVSYCKGLFQCGHVAKYCWREFWLATYDHFWLQTLLL